jgi:hypothetical protein
VGLAEGSYFVTPGMSSLTADVTLDRLNGRKSLLEQLNQVRSALDCSSVAGESRIVIAPIV